MRSAGLWGGKRGLSFGPALIQVQISWSSRSESEYKPQLTGGISRTLDDVIFALHFYIDVGLYTQRVTILWRPYPHSAHDKCSHQNWIWEKFLEKKTIFVYSSLAWASCSLRLIGSNSTWLDSTWLDSTRLDTFDFIEPVERVEQVETSVSSETSRALPTWRTTNDLVQV